MLPSDVREMIQLRLTRLSSPARELLAASAVLDHDFTFEELCQVAHVATQDGLFALDEAIEALLLEESPRQSGKVQAVSYVFIHDKIREVVYSEAVDARRRIFHGRALQVLEQEGASTACTGLSRPGKWISRPGVSLEYGGGRRGNDRVCRA